MRLKAKHAWFLAFTAVFAALAGFVFWGTWSLGMVPVMPDCPTSFSADRVGDFIRTWFVNGKFVPGDVIAFVGDPYFWVELQYVIALFSAACGMAYFLLGRGLSRFSAYSAGLLLAFCGYWVTLFSAGHLGWFQWMTYGVFAFGLVDRVLEKGRLRHSVFLGALVAWGSFYQADLWLLFTLLTAAYFIFRSLVVRPGWKAWITRSLAALAVFAAIGAASFRNALVNDLSGRDKQIEEGQTVAGDGLSPEEKRWRFVTNWSMPPEDTLEFFNARAHGDTSCRMTLTVGQMRGNGIRPYTGRLGRPLMPSGEEAPSGNYRQHSLYIGWVTCLFAVVGIVWAFRSRRSAEGAIRDKVRVCFFFAAAAVVFWLFSMGRYAEPIYRLVYALPFGDYLRAPVKWHHLTEFSIVVLAAFGIEFLWNLSRKYGTLPRVLLVAAVIYGVFDLASEARRFCAPHTADTQIGPLPQPLPPDPSSRREFIDQVRRHGLKPAGTVKQEFRLNDGSTRLLDVLVVEQKTARPEPSVRNRESELKGAAFATAVLSLAATFSVLIFGIVALSFRPGDRIRI
jgi:hypothetical protein